MTFDLLAEMRQAAAEPQGNGEYPITGDDVFRWADEVEKLLEEISVLRLYGNKDCTAMADEALAAKEANNT